MLACLDVQYASASAKAACVLFDTWTASAPAREFTVTIHDPLPYEPGAFYKRELPCLLAALAQVTEPIEAIVIDGYVHLDANQKPGLGAKLHEALAGKIPIIGVAKTNFATAAPIPILRGSSASPLFITAIGLDANIAAANIQSMHGPHRIPTLIKRADQLCRGISLS